MFVQDSLENIATLGKALDINAKAASVFVVFILIVAQ
jgi:hypothetical protein